MSEKINELRDQKLEMVKTIFEQNFLHARHVTSERHWFTNVYILVVAGALTFLSASKSVQFLCAIFLSLLILSLLGIFISLKLGGELTNIHKMNEKLIDEYFETLKSYVGFPLKGRPWSLIRLRYMYPLIFSSTSGIWAVLLLNPNSSMAQLVLSGFLGLFLGIILDVLFFDP